MVELHKTTAIVSAGTFAEMASGLISNKIVSVIMGTIGIGLIGQLNNYFSLGATVAEFGFLLAITRYVAEAREKQDDRLMGTVLATSFLFTSIVAIALILLSFLFSKQLSVWILGDRSLHRMIWIGAPGILFFSLYRKIDSAFQGLRDVRTITRVRVIVSILAPCLTLMLILIWGLSGAVASLTLRQIAAAGIGIFFLLGALKRKGFSIKNLKYDWSMLKRLIMIGMNIVVVAIMGAVNLFIVRNQIVNKLGLDGAGIFQAAWGSIFMATNLTMSTLSYYTFPIISGLSDDKKRGEVINESLAFGIVIVMTGCLALSVPRELAMRILFRGGFQPAGELLPLFGLGVVFYIAFWTIGTPLIPKNRMLAFVLLNALPAASFPLLTAVCLPRFGLVGVGLAYIIANLVTLVVITVDEFRSIDFHLSRDNIVLILGTIITMVGQILLTEPNTISIMLRLGLAAFWVATVLRFTGRYLAWAKIWEKVRHSIG